MARSSAKKTKARRTAKNKFDEQLVSGIQWHHRDDSALPDFNKWVMVGWWSKSQEHTERAVGYRVQEAGGGWTWKLPKPAAEHFEFWAYVTPLPQSRKPKPAPPKPIGQRILSLREAAEKRRAYFDFDKDD